MMRNFILLSVLLTQTQCQNAGIHCSEESGIPCFHWLNTGNGDNLQALPRRDPGKVGDVTTENVEGGVQTLITKATDPPIFELPDFLTDSECDHIIELAKETGMIESTLFGEEALVSMKDMRVTKTIFIPGAKDEVLRRIQNRTGNSEELKFYVQKFIMIGAIALTKLPKEIVYGSEDIQIGHYHVGGFYAFHYDSHPVSRDMLMEKPCCQHTATPHSANKCTICRYVTILMYLNDVEEGGETAFPLADKPNISYNEHLANMSDSCLNAPVIVAPKKGKAVMWYNNVIDDEHGWLGVHDTCSLHGGCPILKGDKWISNVWINAPQHHSVNKRTIYHTEL